MRRRVLYTLVLATLAVVACDTGKRLPVVLGAVSGLGVPVAVAGDAAQKLVVVATEDHRVAVVDYAGIGQGVEPGASFLSFSGDVSAVAIAGTVAYAVVNSGSTAKLHALDLVDPANPRVRSTLSLGGSGAGTSVLLDGTVGIVGRAGVGQGSLRFVDLADPLYPDEIGSMPVAYEPHELAMAEAIGALFVASAADVSVYDAADILAPSYLHKLGEMLDISGSGSRFYGTRPGGLFEVVAYTSLDPLAGSQDLSTIQSLVHASSGMRVYTGLGPVVSLLDFSDPSAPVRLESVMVTGDVVALDYRGRWVFAAGDTGTLTILHEQ
jgi:hypothetical protein